MTIGFAGMGLELGIDLFIFGGEVFHKSIFHLLSVAYELMGREPYIDIIQVTWIFCLVNWQNGGAADFREAERPNLT